MVGFKARPRIRKTPIQHDDQRRRWFFKCFSGTIIFKVFGEGPQIPISVVFKAHEFLFKMLREVKINSDSHQTFLKLT